MNMVTIKLNDDQMREVRKALRNTAALLACKSNELWTEGYIDDAWRNRAKAALLDEVVELIDNNSI